MSKSYVATKGSGKISFPDEGGKTCKYQVVDGVLTLEDRHAELFDKMLASGERFDLNQMYRPFNREAALQIAKEHQSKKPAAIAGGMTAGHMTEMMMSPAQQIAKRLVDKDKETKETVLVENKAPSNNEK